MRLRSLLAAAATLAAVSAGLIQAPAHAAADDPIKKIDPAVRISGTHRAIVQVQSPAQAKSLAATAEAVTPRVDNVAPTPDALAGRLDFFVYEGTVDEFKKIAGQADVVAIREDHLNSPNLVRSTAIIGADKAHAGGVTGAGKAVAVLDTGIDGDHPFFGGRITAEACFSAENAADTATSLCPSGAPFQIGAGAANATTDACMKDVPPADAAFGICAHGSHVAGIVAGKSHPTQREPSDGVAPGATIVPVQVFSRFANTEYCGGAENTPCVLAYDSSILTGMAYVNTIAKQYNIVSVNLSLGGGKYDTACDTGDGADFKARADELLAQGVATVVAAGNEGHEASVSWPACVSNVVTVGSTDVEYPQVGTHTDDISSFSNRGEMLDLFAPGWPIFSSVPDNKYAGFGGTSMAAPHVAGAFALMREKLPTASVDEIVAKLRAAGKPITYTSAGKQVTTPRLDVWKALPHVECTATYANRATWPGGFQANVTVKNTGSLPAKSWKVSWTFPDGQKVQTLWEGKYTQSGADVTVTNTRWNGNLAVNATTRFGFNGKLPRGGANNPPATLTCTAA
ncbi:S8 family serine peptidase [Nonomuraea mangrovi]|uniref:S8 family serine peptidase n=1 Tax=Nonomuraea mangrovi TaxID=2316207 RepID=A0ABW4T2V3_9ACTN